VHGRGTDLDEFGVELNSFGRICNRVAVRFGLDVGLQREEKKEEEDMVSNRGSVEAGWQTRRQRGTRQHTWARFEKKVGSWSFSSIALV